MSIRYVQFIKELGQCVPFFFSVKKENKWEQLMDEIDQTKEEAKEAPSLIAKINPFSEYNRTKNKKS